ncbi:hypothetical protein HYC85_017931, partial [Camellia sinensis]
QSPISDLSSSSPAAAVSRWIFAVTQLYQNLLDKSNPYKLWSRFVEEKKQNAGEIVSFHQLSCSSVDSEEFEPEALVDSGVAHRQDNSEVKTELEEAHRGWFNSGVDSLGCIDHPFFLIVVLGFSERE